MGYKSVTPFIGIGNTRWRDGKLTEVEVSKSPELNYREILANITLSHPDIRSIAQDKGYQLEPNVDVLNDISAEYKSKLTNVDSSIDKIRNNNYRQIRITPDDFAGSVVYLEDAFYHLKVNPSWDKGDLFEVCLLYRLQAEPNTYSSVYFVSPGILKSYYNNFDIFQEDNQLFAQCKISDVEFFCIKYVKYHKLRTPW